MRHPLVQAGQQSVVVRVALVANVELAGELRV